MNNSSPFYISLIGSEPTYDFIVNAGDINPFILSTYKAKYDEIKGKKTIEERDYYARVGEGTSVSKSFKFGDFWTPTFSTNSNCQVYLTIPKIPAGFNFIPGQTEGLRKDWWLKPSLGNINFLNQFKIVKSNDVDFDEEKTKNFSSIDTDDTDWRNSAKNNTQFLADTNYSGKVYIKLADINSPVGNVKKFFNSNVIAPTRYIRYGSLGLRNLRLFVDVFGLISESIDTKPGNAKNNFDQNWQVVDFFHKRSYSNLRFPEIFDFKESSIINLANDSPNHTFFITRIPCKRRDTSLVSEHTQIKHWQRG